MIEYIKNKLIDAIVGIRNKRLKLDQQKYWETVIEVANLPSKQRRKYIQDNLWLIRKEIDTPAGQMYCQMLDEIKDIGRAVDQIRSSKKNDKLCIAEILFSEKQEEGDRVTLRDS